MFETSDRQKNQYFLCIMFPNSLFILLLPTIVIIVMIMIIMMIIIIVIIMIMIIIMIIMMIAITKIIYLPVPADPVIVIDGKLTFKGAVKEVVKAEEVEIALNA